ncbi:MAG: hypothetical protein DMG71_07340 [Acidobacteria bacterium]|nr:MAG: hypothetical protein DMG71_07340 [Acidobacteriota bacterium]
MKPISIAAGILMVCTLIGIAFAGEVPLIADPSVPAATGKVNFLHDKNGNIKFHIDTKHLARPNSLTPSKSVYVVWIQPRGKDPINAGVLTVNDQLEGSFRATTPHQTFDLFITAEDSANVDHPTGPPLLKTTVQAQS